MTHDRPHRRTDRPHRDLPTAAVLAAIETLKLTAADIDLHPDRYHFPADSLAFAQVLIGEYEAERDYRDRLRRSWFAPTSAGHPADLDEIKARLPLPDYITKWTGTELRPMGRQLRGRCPLHLGERTDDLAVDPAQGLWHCFGCLRGGTIIDLALDLLGLSSVGQAVDVLLLEAGLERPRRTVRPVIDLAAGGQRHAV